MKYAMSAFPGPSPHSVCVCVSEGVGEEEEEVYRSTVDCPLTPSPYKAAASQVI